MEHCSGSSRSHLKQKANLTINNICGRKVMLLSLPFDLLLDHFENHYLQTSQHSKTNTYTLLAFWENVISVWRSPMWYIAVCSSQMRPLSIPTLPSQHALPSASVTQTRPQLHWSEAEEKEKAVIAHPARLRCDQDLSRRRWHKHQQQQQQQQCGRTNKDSGKRPRSRAAKLC